MIQDAHPLRSGVPDGYVAYYRIEVLVGATGPWNLNLERLPSGFTGRGVANNGVNTFVTTGIGRVGFPAGMKVRGAKGSYSGPNNTLANQRHVFVTDIDEAAGTADFDIAVPAGTVGSPQDPTALPALNDSWILIELDLETV